MNKTQGSLNSNFNKIDFLILFAVIQFTVVPFWSTNKVFITILLFFIIILSIYRFKKIIFDTTIGILFFIYLTLALLQGTKWGYSFFSTLSSFALIFLLAYYLYKLYKIDFLLLFEKVLWIWTWVCLVFFIGHLLSIEFSRTLLGLIDHLESFSSYPYEPRSLIIYTYRSDLFTTFGFPRNSGFLHEPGGYAAFLTLGIVINYIRGLTLFDKRNYIYYGSIITTFSTAGYLALATLGLLLLYQRNSRILSFLILPFFIMLSYNTYFGLDFLKGKIEMQYEDQIDKSLDQYTTGRIFGARKSIFVLSQYPLQGRGLLAMTKPDNPLDPEYADYGWLSEIAKFGLVVGMIYMYFFFRGIYHFVRKNKYKYGFYEFVIISGAIMINLSAQVYISTPFFLIFLFHGIYKRNKIITKQINYRPINENNNNRI